MAPAPTRGELQTILALAARVPDHGKLAPWRFIVFEGEGLERAGAVVAEAFARREPQADAARIELGARPFRPLAAGHRGGVARRAACQDSAVGTGIVGWRGLHGADRRGHGAGFPHRLGDRLVCL